MKVSVIGAANVDVLATPLGKYVPRDSNPGKVEIGFGGVGRNIAHNLALLGCEVDLCTAFGGDSVAKALMESCEKVGMDLRNSVILPESRSNFFLCISDEYGEMRSAVSDMEIMENLDSRMLHSRLDSFNSSDAVVIDCNLPGWSILYLVNRITVPLFIDATSSIKASLLSVLLGGMLKQPNVTLKVNRLEAQTLTHIQDPARSAEWLLSNGFKRVIVTLGKDGVYCASEDEHFKLGAKRVDVVNSTGAGDALLACVVYALLSGRPFKEAVELGLRGAALALQSPLAINEEISKLKLSTPQ